jgi:hypothetical protein
MMHRKPLPLLPFIIHNPLLPQELQLPICVLSELVRREIAVRVVTRETDVVGTVQWFWPRRGDVGFRRERRGKVCGVEVVGGDVEVGVGGGGRPAGWTVWEEVERVEFGAEGFEGLPPAFLG